ncbi:MAG: glycosyltransferase, partial [Bacteroidota bacterium]
IFAYEKLLGELRRRHRCKTLLLIHNYEHQGELVPDMFRFMDEESREVLARLYRRYGNASLLGLAIDRSDFVGTVSKGYAEELMTQRAPHPNFHFLQRRSDCVLDFTNGVDYSEWHPRNSPHLPWPYDWESRATKRAYRREVLYQCGLADDERPLALLMARLTPQKGIYLLMNPALEDEAALAQLQRHLRTGWKIIVYGNPSGGTQGRIHHLFSLAQQRFPNRFFYDADYTEPKAHRYLAAADLLLSPSKFEPCGLVQLYAMAFGTVPLVNPIGGLGETVICHQREPKRATGFHLSEYTTDSLHRSLQRAIRLYGLYPDKWEALMRRGMHSDFSWERQIQRYRDFFERYHSRRRLPRELV